MGFAPLEAAAGLVTASTLLILPIMLLVDRPWTLPAAPSLAVWAALAGLALLSTVAAHVLYFRILAAAGVGERLEAGHFAGMALIGVGRAVIDGRVGRVPRPAK